MQARSEHRVNGTFALGVLSTGGPVVHELDLEDVLETPVVLWVTLFSFLLCKLLFKFGYTSRTFFCRQVELQKIIFNGWLVLHFMVVS